MHLVHLKSYAKAIAVGIILAATFLVGVHQVISARSLQASASAYGGQNDRPSKAHSRPACVRTSKGVFDCTDDATKAVVRRETEAGRLIWYKTPVKTFQAKVTQYSPADSCHYPTKGGCLTAAGTIATAMRTVACPRHIKLGTHVRIEGKEYVCEDRYARFLDQKRNLPTVDIFVNQNPTGLKTLTIEVL